MTVEDANGNTYDIETADGTVTVEQGLPTVGDAPPTDPDDDGHYEDVDGDGEAGYTDVKALFDNRNSDAVQNNTDAFDFDDDGEVGFSDIVALFRAL